jgi:hypothetical protein
VEGIDPDLTGAAVRLEATAKATLREIVEDSCTPSGTAAAASRGAMVLPTPARTDMGASGSTSTTTASPRSIRMLTTVVGCPAQLEAPVIRPPHDPSPLDGSPPGGRRSTRRRCAACHADARAIDTKLVDGRPENAGKASSSRRPGRRRSAIEPKRAPTSPSSSTSTAT